MLSQKAKYALRALLMLAEAPSEELVLIKDVADRQGELFEEDLHALMLDAQPATTTP